MNYYSLQEKATGKYVVRIKRLHHSENTYLYRTSKTPAHITESDIDKIANFGDFNIKLYNYENKAQSNKVKNKINKSLDQVLLQRRRKLTVKRNLIELVITKRVNLYLISYCDSVKDYNDYIEHDLRDCLNELEFKQIKKAGEKYGWKK